MVLKAVCLKTEEITMKCYGFTHVPESFEKRERRCTDIVCYVGSRSVKNTLNKRQKRLPFHVFRVWLQPVLKRLRQADGLQNRGR